MTTHSPPAAEPAAPPIPDGQNLRFILGLKLSQLRKDKNFPLKRLAALSGLSISYLNEIERGKKYPKPEKILALAEALGVKYEDLVSLSLGANMSSLERMLKTGALQNFPLELFGVNSSGLMEMMSGAPDRFSALIDTAQKIMRRYDLRVEALLLTAMRSYLEMHENHFPDLEQAAEKFRREHRWMRPRAGGEAPAPAELVARLREHLAARHGYALDDQTLGEERDLADRRSVFIAGRPPRLLLNPLLEPMQQALILAREIGYHALGLGLEGRMVTASPDEAVSFDQHLNHQRASYFAGALLLDPARVRAAVADLLARRSWEPEALRALPARFGATPEMMFHRLSQVLPQAFGLRAMYFLRFEHYADTGRYRLAKELHFTRMHGTHSIGVNEHHCRRWVTMRLLAELADAPAPAPGMPAAAGKSSAPAELPLVGAQRSRFPGGDEYFSLSMATPQPLSPGVNSCVTLGFLMNEKFKETVRFWNDSAIPDREVNETCERCGLLDCLERAVEPRILRRDEQRARRNAALKDLVARLGRGT